MHIAIDGFNIAMPRGTGVATYGRMLAKNADRQRAMRSTAIFGLTISQRRLQTCCARFNFSTDWLRRKGRRPPASSEANAGSMRLSFRFSPDRGHGTIPLSGQYRGAELSAKRLPAFDRIVNACRSVRRGAQAFQV